MRSRWRFVALAGIPYLLLMGLLGLGLVEIVPADPRDSAPVSAFAPVLAALLVLALGTLAGMVTARRPAIHFVGYALYAVALAAGLGYGAMRAVVNSEGGLVGEPPGPLWITVLLIGGALLCGFCLLALLVQIVLELRTAPAASGRPAVVE